MLAILLVALLTYPRLCEKDGRLAGFLLVFAVALFALYTLAWWWAPSLLAGIARLISGQVRVPSVPSSLHSPRDALNGEVNVYVSDVNVTASRLVASHVAGGSAHVAADATTTCVTYVNDTGSGYVITTRIHEDDSWLSLTTHTAPNVSKPSRWDYDVDAAHGSAAVAWRTLDAGRIYVQALNLTTMAWLPSALVSSTDNTSSIAVSVNEERVWIAGRPNYTSGALDSVDCWVTNLYGGLQRHVQVWNTTSGSIRAVSVDARADTGYFSWLSNQTGTWKQYVRAYNYTSASFLGDITEVGVADYNETLNTAGVAVPEGNEYMYTIRRNTGVTGELGVWNGTAGYTVIIRNSSPWTMGSLAVCAVGTTARVTWAEENAQGGWDVGTRTWNPDDGLGEILWLDGQNRSTTTREWQPDADLGDGLAATYVTNEWGSSLLDDVAGVIHHRAPTLSVSAHSADLGQNHTISFVVTEQGPTKMGLDYVRLTVLGETHTYPSTESNHTWFSLVNDSGSHAYLIEAADLLGFAASSLGNLHTGYVPRLTASWPDQAEEGDVIKVTATASDNRTSDSGISSVQVYIDGEWRTMTQDSDVPTLYTWSGSIEEISGEENETRIVRVRATDAAGNSNTTSGEIYVYTPSAGGTDEEKETAYYYAAVYVATNMSWLVWLMILAALTLGAAWAVQYSARRRPLVHGVWAAFALVGAVPMILSSGWPAWLLAATWGPVVAWAGATAYYGLSKIKKMEIAGKVPLFWTAVAGTVVLVAAALILAMGGAV